MSESQTVDHFLDSFVNPRSVAFFGANEELLKNMGAQQLLTLIDSGYQGPIYPIHPRLESVFGLKAYKKITDLPEVPDLAVIILPTRIIHEIFEEIGQFGVKNVVLVTAGFRETNNAKGEKELKEIAQKYGFRFLGPNCIGFINSRVVIPNKPDSMFNCTYVYYPLGQGNVSIASQSGTFACHTNLLLEERNLALAKAFSVGNEADIDICDCLEYFEQDPQTEIILLYLEEIKRGKKFRELARRITKKKPIIAIYVGGTVGGARAASSHTGSMGGNDSIFNAVFKQTGIIRVYSYEEWVDSASLFSKMVPLGAIPKGRRLAVITNSGGPAATTSDLSSRLGLNLPLFSEELQTNLRQYMPATGQTTNPVDYTFNINPANYYVQVPKVISKSGEVDAIICYGAFGDGFFQHGKIGMKIIEEKNLFAGFKMLEELMESILKDTLRTIKKTKVPIIFINLIGLPDRIFGELNRMGIPIFRFEHQAVKAMLKLVEYGESLQQNP